MDPDPAARYKSGSVSLLPSPLFLIFAIFMCLTFTVERYTPWLPIIEEGFIQKRRLKVVAAVWGDRIYSILATDDMKKGRIHHIL